MCALSKDPRWEHLEDGEKISAISRYKKIDFNSYTRGTRLEIAFSGNFNKDSYNEIVYPANCAELRKILDQMANTIKYIMCADVWRSSSITSEREIDYFLDKVRAISCCLQDATAKYLSSEGAITLVKLTDKRDCVPYNTIYYALARQLFKVTPDMMSVSKEMVNFMLKTSIDLQMFNDNKTIDD